MVIFTSVIRKLPYKFAEDEAHFQLIKVLFYNLAEIKKDLILHRPSYIMAVFKSNPAIILSFYFIHAFEAKF